MRIFGEDHLLITEADYQEYVVLLWRGYSHTKRKLTSKLKTAQKLAPYSEEVIVIRLLLEIAESEELCRQTRFYGLEIPEGKTDWWYPDNHFRKTYVPHGALTPKGRHYVRMLIKQERRKNVEWWAKIFTPILALLVSVLGLLVALSSMRRC